MECLWWQMSFCHYHGFKGLFSKSDSGSLHIVSDVCYWMILFFWKVSKCTCINTHDGCPVVPLPKFQICDFITSSKHKYLSCCSSTLVCSVPGFVNQSGSPIWPQVLQAALMGELKPAGIWPAIDQLICFTVLLTVIKTINTFSFVECLVVWLMV